MAQQVTIDDNFLVGCMDENASNYNPEATVPDPGLCEYYQSFDLNKKVYGSKNSRENLDTFFKELDVQNYTIKEFFKLYNELFYEIPKKGFLSHNVIVERSKKYIGNYAHPRNTDLLNLIKQLKDALWKFYSIPDRHSIIRNNSVLSSRESKKLYYIQSFKAREIVDGSDGIEILNYIKEINGFNIDAEIHIPISDEAINLLPVGPPISSIGQLGDHNFNIAEMNIYAVTGGTSLSNEHIINNYSSLSSNS
jgi:Holliday junction resolvase RusA-like endonuclease